MRRAVQQLLWGVFAQHGHSAGTAPIITVIIQVTTPKTTCGIMHNPFKTQKFKHLMLAMGPRDLNSAPYSPVHCSSHSMTSFQSSELTELPVLENSQLFAQRAVRPHGQVFAAYILFVSCVALCSSYCGAFSHSTGTARAQRQLLR